MTNQVTDNLQLITLDDVDTYSWLADYIINLNKINNAATPPRPGAEKGLLHGEVTIDLPNPMGWAGRMFTVSKP